MIEEGLQGQEAAIAEAIAARIADRMTRRSEVEELREARIALGDTIRHFQDLQSGSVVPYTVWLREQLLREGLRTLPRPAAPKVERQLSGRMVAVPRFSMSGEYQGTTWQPAEDVTIAGRPAVKVMAAREKVAAIAAKHLDVPVTRRKVRRDGGWTVETLPQSDVSKMRQGLREVFSEIRPPKASNKVCLHEARHALAFLLRGGQVDAVRVGREPSEVLPGRLRNGACIGEVADGFDDAVTSYVGGDITDIREAMRACPDDMPRVQREVERAFSRPEVKEAVVKVARALQDKGRLTGASPRSAAPLGPRPRVSQ